MDKRQTANRGLLEWVDSMVVAAVLLALVFTFGVRIVQVDGTRTGNGCCFPACPMSRSTATW